MSFGLKDVKYKRCGSIDGCTYWEQCCHHCLSLCEMMSSLLGLAEQFVNFPVFSGEVVNFPEMFSELGDSSNIMYIQETHIYAS